MKPNWLKELYPFKSNYFKLSSGLNQHYVDEGSGEVILMVHGNPTWSFFYRNLISEFSTNYRVIAPDHIGCGFSDKPQDWSYTLSNHIDNLAQLIQSLKVEKLNLVVHDWGGAIGFGLLAKYPDIAKKVVILNTAAFRSDYIAPQINICRTPILGELVIRSFNAFAWPSTFMSVTKKLPKNVVKGFLLPYNNYKNRIATAKFVTDIPMNDKHISYSTLKKIEESLPQHKIPKLIIWGKKDFCFNDYFLDKWQSIYPDASVKVLENAGHYLIEDEPQEVISSIKSFL